MQVRIVNSNRAYEKISAFEWDDRQWYVLTDGNSTFNALRDECTEIPTDGWVDVTAECVPAAVTEDDIQHNGKIILNRCGYRVRKVNVAEVDGPYAFIVERKEPQ